MEPKTETIWGIADIGRYRGVSKVQASNNMKQHPLVPDYVAGDGKRYWKPERIMEWVETLPRAGGYRREKKNSAEK